MICRVFFNQKDGVDYRCGDLKSHSVVTHLPTNPPESHPRVLLLARVQKKDVGTQTLFFLFIGMVGRDGLLLLFSFPAGMPLS